MRPLRPQLLTTLRNIGRATRGTAFFRAKDKVTVHEGKVIATPQSGEGLLPSHMNKAEVWAAHKLTKLGLVCKESWDDGPLAYFATEKGIEAIREHGQVRERFFTLEFSMGDRVAVIREEHGWHDGRVQGSIIKIEPFWCVVRVDADDEWHGNSEWVIGHPRDIHKVRQ